MVGCGECATTCKTGGEPELLKMKEALGAQGKEVVGMCLPDAPCVASQIKTAFAKNMKSLRQAEAILVLACGLGTQSARDNDRLALAVFPALNTVFGAVVDGQGNFYEKCSLCGDCVLGQTAGICPVSLCAKGLLNGPCGGMDKGKCEVDRDKDCAWVLLYQELAKKKRLGMFREIKDAKDHQKTTKPHKLIMVPDECKVDKETNP